MFNEKLKIARKQKSLSQAALGKLLGVQAQTVGRWETGKSKPNVETLNKLCEILDVTLHYFISEEHIDYQLTLDETFIIKKYRELSDDGKEIIVALIKTL